MKILHVSPSYYPAFKFGGPINSVHFLNQSLFKNGVEVDILTTNAGLRDNPSIKPNCWTQLDGMRIFYADFIGYEHYNFSTSLFKLLGQIVGNYDLVHITAVWNFPVWAASYHCRKAKIPYIISTRGTIYPETVALKSANFKKIYYQLFAKSCLDNASALHFTSTDEKVKVLDFLKINVKSFVLPNGLNFENQEDKFSHFSTFFPKLTDKPYLLFLGRISKKKGLDILAEAFGKFSLQFPDLQLVIAGPDNEGYAETVKQLLRENRIFDKTHFVGEVLGDVKWSAYHSAKAFVLSSYSENFGMSVVEAMSCGIPVVISDQVGIFSDIADNNAGYICQTNAASLYENLLEMMKNDEKTKKIAINGKKMVEEFYDIDAIGKKIIEFYSKIIATTTK